MITASEGADEHHGADGEGLSSIMALGEGLSSIIALGDGLSSIMALGEGLSSIIAVGVGDAADGLEHAAATPKTSAAARTASGRENGRVGPGMMRPPSKGSGLPTVRAACDVVMTQNAPRRDQGPATPVCPALW